MVLWILAGLTTLLLLLTLLPLSKRQEWWIRGLDFPRFQFALAGLALLVAAGLALDFSTGLAWWVAGTALVCTGYQLWWIFPYTPLRRPEVRAAPAGVSAPRLRIMSANVLMTNRRAAELLALVRAEHPHVLVTLETNGWWEQQLAPLHEDYPHRLRCPLENLYGMHLYSRWPLEDSRIQFLVEKDVPSMHTLLVLPSGERVRLHCLHPAPPSPTENDTSRERDAELIMVGKSVVGSRHPVIVAGDLNDVAWSATTRLFRKISRLLDPRIGRGRYNSYHAQHGWLRWPVDHFFHSADFSCVEIKRLPAFGSDHFPVLLDVTLGARDQQPELAADREDEQEAEQKMVEENTDTSQVHRPGEARSGAPPQTPVARSRSPAATSRSPKSAAVSRKARAAPHGS